MGVLLIETCSCSQLYYIHYWTSILIFINIWVFFLLFSGFEFLRASKLIKAQFGKRAHRLVFFKEQNKRTCLVIWKSRVYTLLFSLLLLRLGTMQPCFMAFWAFSSLSSIKVMGQHLATLLGRKEGSGFGSNFRLPTKYHGKNSIDFSKYTHPPYYSGIFLFGAHTVILPDWTLKKWGLSNFAL